MVLTAGMEVNVKDRVFVPVWKATVAHIVKLVRFGSYFTCMYSLLSNHYKIF